MSGPNGDPQLPGGAEEEGAEEGQDAESEAGPVLLSGHRHRLRCPSRLLSLSPVLFNIYLQPLASIIKSHNLQYHIYADDTQLYFKVGKDQPIGSQLASCLEDINNWMSTNFLKLNEYESINYMLDQINFCLDHLEERNDHLHEQLKELLESNRQARREFQEQRGARLSQGEAQS